MDDASPSTSPEDPSVSPLGGYQATEDLKASHRRSSVPSSTEDLALQRFASHLIQAAVEESLVAFTSPRRPRPAPARAPRAPGLDRRAPDLPHEAVARALLDSARRSLTEDPKLAHHAAALAEKVLEASPTLSDEHLPTVAGLYKANAARVLGDLETAATLLNAHHGKIPACQPGALRGDLHLLASSIRSDQQLVLEACAHLQAALADYGPLHDSKRKARALIHAGSLLNRIGDHDGAIDAAESAAELLSPDTDLDLYLSARHNQASYLILTHQFDRALQILVEIGPLYPRTGSAPYVLKYRWLCARIAGATGDPRGAAGTFADIRDRLTARGLHRDAALVALDRARLFLNEPDSFRAALEGLESLMPRHASLETRRTIRAYLRGLRASDRPSLTMLRRLARLVERSG